MNLKIDPEIALKKVDLFIEEIVSNRFYEKNYMQGFEDLKRLNKEIEGLLKATFIDHDNRIRNLYNPYSDIRNQENYISDLDNTRNNLLSLKNELSLYIDSKVGMNKTFPKSSEMKEINIQNVEQLALSGDINNYNVKVYLNALIHAIEYSEKIPEDKKKNLVDKIKNIINDPYVAGISAGLIVEAIKKGFVGK